MDLLGIGPLELVFILIIALIIFGPNDIVRAGKTLGRFMRKVVTSEGWRAFQQASKGMRDIPTTLMREAGLEEDDLRDLTGMKDFEEATKGLEKQISPWTTPPKFGSSDTKNIGGLQANGDVNSSDDDVSLSEEDEEQISEEPSAPPPGSPFSETIDDNS